MNSYFHRMIVALNKMSQKKKAKDKVIPKSNQ